MKRANVDRDLAKISNSGSKEMYLRIANIIDIAGSQIVSELGNIYFFEIKGLDGVPLDFTIDLKNGNGAIYFGKPGA